MNKTRFLSISNSPNGGAIQIAGLYLLIGGLWIIFSDQIAARIALNQQMLVTISVYKGWGYVLITAFLLYLLIQRHTAALRASEERLHRVIDAMPAFISYVDADRHYQFTNKTYKEWFDDQVEGKHIEDVIGKEAYKTASKYMDKVLSGETTSYETEIDLQGNERFISTTYIPDMSVDGRVKGFFVMGLDRTAQKKAEEGLRLWADAFEGCYHGIAIGDPHTNRIVVCNPAFAGMLKGSVEDIVGSTILSLYAPSDHEHVRRQIEKADQIGHARYEAHMTRSGKDGSVFPVQIDVVSVLDDGGELLHRVVTAQDISERKQAEEYLRRFELLSQHSRDIILFMDRENGRILEANAAALQAYGYSREELVSLTIRDLRASDTQALTAEQMAQADAGGILFETIHQRKDGTTFPVEVSSQGATIGDVRTLISIVRDITERKHTARALRESQVRLDFALEKSHTGGWDLDLIDHTAYRTLEHDRIFGYESLLPQWTYEIFLDHVIPEDRAEVNRLFQEATTTQTDCSFECRIRRKDGEMRWIWAVGGHLFDEAGHANRLAGIVQDITERKKSEEALRLKDELLRLTSELAKVGGWEFDAETGKGTWTDEVARIHDLDPAQETNIEIGLSYYEGESREKVEQAVKEAIEHAEPYDLELEMVTAKGNHKWARTMALPIVQDGKVVKVQGIFQDITERKQIEKALQTAHDELELKVQERTAALTESNALLQAMMDHMPDQIYFKDMQGRFIRNSRAQANLLGLNDPAQAIAKTDFDFFPHASRAYAEEQEIMRSGKPLVDLEEWVVWPDGREMWVSTTKVPLRNAEGQTIGIFGISHDITERKQTEQAIWQLNADLEKQAEQLKAANKELEAFSYSVSHDLRAPLRAIDGYTRILLEDYEPLLDAEGKRVCSIISREARRMGQLIDDLLAFSRLGRKEMHASKVDMRALAVSVLNDLLKEADRERIDFQIGRLPSVKGDSALIRQVWANLLANAIKFTSRKERALIEVGSKSSKDELIYYVRDSGAGFDMEYANKLFGVFQRLHSESEFDGTGVGLAIVQRIVHRHEGRVWAEGEVGKGATFYFALPRKEHHHE